MYGRAAGGQPGAEGGPAGLRQQRHPRAADEGAAGLQGEYLSVD